MGVSNLSCWDNILVVEIEFSNLKMNGTAFMRKRVYFNMFNLPYEMASAENRESECGRSRETRDRHSAAF